jgi:ABC-type polysaccharide/polyol phosphate transport system ATPase subunit
MQKQTSAEDDTALTAEEIGSGARDLASGPVVIEVRDLSKAFRIPEQKVDTLKERVTHPFSRPTYRRLQALKDVSFDVHKGEFFGIVGRNGSGKSTLLKIMASIYRPDRGRVRMAGRVAPFIELGVGFNPELTARENCVLGGVLMGLGRREAAKRLDAVLDFGELREFVDLKVKNYSSGMMVRLAFSIMVQADADIMLIDEVLAVGDAAFGQKCMDVFYRRRDAGKTVVLVTHDMSTVQSLCHRAMVIHDSEVQHVGEPEETAMRYFRLNFADGAGQLGEADLPPPERPVALDLNARLVHARLVDEAGDTVANLEQDTPILLDVVIEAARELVDPIFVFHIRNAEGVVVFAFTRRLEDRVTPGQRIRLGGEIENRLVPGIYSLECWIRRDRRAGDMALQSMRLARFVVYGTAPRHGLVSLKTTVEPVPERESGARAATRRGGDEPAGGGAT